MKLCRVTSCLVILMNCLSLSSAELRMQVFTELQLLLLIFPAGGTEDASEVDRYDVPSANTTVDREDIGSDMADRGENSSSCRV